MLHLALCIAALAAGYAQAASIPECCKEKTVGGVPYVLVDSDSDTMQYGCKSNCVFERKGNPGPRFCFTEGDLEVVCGEDGDSDDFSSTFDEFILKNNKTYESEEEKQRRQEIWKVKVEEIIQHNKAYDEGKVSFKLGENEYTDLSYSELLSTITGFILNGTESRKQEKQRKVADLQNLPDSVDWRTQGYVTPVKNQGPCGSCWAFSATGAMEGAWAKSTGELISLSEQNILDCNKEGRGCNGGWMSYAFEYVIDNDGIEAESSYPYRAKQGACEYEADKKVATMESYSYVARSEADLMNAVATVGPVSVGIQVQNSFFGYKSGIYYDATCPTDRANHAVLVVGYGTDGSGQKYWIVKNSWGTSWGDGGYIYMARDKGNLCAIANYAVYPVAPKPGQQQLFPVDVKISTTHPCSTPLTCGAAKFCSDSNLDTRCHSDGSEEAPWVALVFRTPVWVEKVELVNVYTQDLTLLRNVVVKITDTLPTDGKNMFSGGSVFGSFSGPATADQVVKLEGTPQQGKIVLVQMKNKRPIILREIRVFGTSGVEDAFLITGGWERRMQTTAEVYFPSKNKGCSVPNYAFPGGVHTHTMNTFKTKTLICIQSSCYDFSPASTTVWPVYANLTEKRYEHTSWVSSFGVVLIGGYAPYSALAETTAELVPGGNLFTLPRTRDACAIGDSSSNSFILTGGQYSKKKAARYDFKGLVEELPDMNKDRTWHACGSYGSAGKMVLIVASGADSEKLVIGEGRWSMVSGNLPKFISLPKGLNFDNKFYILGGRGSSDIDILTDIFEYDADQDAWNKVGDMQMGRYRHAAAVIQADYEDLCN